MYILVFKTNIETANLDKVKETLNAMVGISKWSVDVEDSDKVLRIVTTYLKSYQIANAIQSMGFFCEEL